MKREFCSNGKQTGSFSFFFLHSNESVERDWRDNDNHNAKIFFFLFFSSSIFLSRLLFLVRIRLSQPCSSSLVLQSLDQTLTSFFNCTSFPLLKKITKAKSNSIFLSRVSLQFHSLFFSFNDLLYLTIMFERKNALSWLLL